MPLRPLALFGAGKDDLPEGLQQEQVVLLYRHAPPIFFGNLAGGLGIALMLWETTPRPQLLAWLLALTGITVLRALLVLCFRSHSRGEDGFAVRPWARLFVVGAAASGMTWGALSLLNFDAGPTNLAGIGLVLAGLVTAWAPALGTFFPAYMAFAVASILPFALRCTLSSHPTAFGMALVAVTFLLSSLAFGWLNSRTALQGIRLRWDNLDLMRRLREQTRAAEKARQQAEAASAAKTRFLATASHDLRQPLQSITLLAEALQLETDPRASRQLLCDIQEAGGSMSELMNELLDYAHIHAGGLEAVEVGFDLGALTRRLAAEFQPLARSKGLRLRCRERCATVVRSDPGMLERMLRNLLSNAIKYTSRGGVLIGLRRRGSWVRVEIWDTGKGIPASRLNDVFHEFYQLDNPERDSRKGLGLGLAIVASLGQLLGVKIAVRSREHRGSVFSLELPLDPAPPPTLEATPVLRSLVGRSAGRILVIDNEPAILHAMGSLLHAWGFASIEAESAEHALSLLDSPPDAILADFRLREGRTGIEAIGQLRARFATPIPAALITGDTDPNRLAEARAHGLPLLQKPTPGPTLHRLLTHLVQRDQGTSADDMPPCGLQAAAARSG